uniref:rRNA biogenesis protein RRP36 n=1 Tax=Globodera pallida TaxID=36090 RepID=A0A183BYX0_GLOPA
MMHSNECPGRAKLRVATKNVQGKKSPQNHRQNCDTSKGWKAQQSSEIFHQDYAFLDELRQSDIQELKKAHRSAKKAGNAPLADRIHRNLLRLENQQKAETVRQKLEQTRAELRRENIERMNRGERPVYLNNAELVARANCGTTAVSPNRVECITDND